MKKLYIVDEERLFSDIVAAAARVQGYHPVQFFDATSAYHFLKEEGVKNSDDLFWVDMYLLPGGDEMFRNFEGDHDEYRVGLRLAKVIIEDEILDSKLRHNLTVYSGHITKELWTAINRFCSETGAQSFQKRAGSEFSELMDRIPKIDKAG